MQHRGEGELLSTCVPSYLFGFDIFFHYFPWTRSVSNSLSFDCVSYN